MRKWLVDDPTKLYIGNTKVYITVGKQMNKETGPFNN
jgi:hypothetical protein